MKRYKQILHRRKYINIQTDIKQDNKNAVRFKYV